VGFGADRAKAKRGNTLPVSLLLRRLWRLPVLGLMF
jgi:hypothetical protein